MKTKFIGRTHWSSLHHGALAAGGLALVGAAVLIAQTPCPEVGVLASDLHRPAKIIQTPSRNLLVAENGTDDLNSGRVSIVSESGERRTLLAGLPSAPAFTGDPSGTSGLYLQGRTLYVVNGQGDVTVPGPAQGTEQANPTPASPIFSSVLALEFSERLEATTTGFALTPADHQALKDGNVLTITDGSGASTTLRLVVDFVDYLPDPRPNYAENVRHSHPYGIVADHSHLFLVDAGFNSVRKVEIASGAEQTLASFPPTPNPLPGGPPMMENVPTSVHWVAGQLHVTLFSGAPFVPAHSRVVQVDPQTGAVVPLVEGLTAAIDSLPLSPDSLDGGLLTLEYNLAMPQPGLGRLQSSPPSTGAPVIHSACLVTPSSMLVDRATDTLILSEFSRGRLVTLPAPPSLARGDSWTRQTDLPLSRAGLAACSLNGIVYAIGGTTGGTEVSLPTVEVYSPEMDSWTSKPGMPTPRVFLVAVALNDKIYAIGGDSTVPMVNPLNTVEAYDPATGTWTPKANLPTARQAMAAGVVDGKIYVIGGLTTFGAPALATVEMYDPATDRWTRKADMPTPRGFLAASVVDGKIYALGGSAPWWPAALATVEMYDPVTDTWTRKTSMPTARGALGISVVHDRIFAMGGRTPAGGGFATVEEYDPATDHWAQRADMVLSSSGTPSPRQHFGVAALNGRVYVIGGSSNPDGLPVGIASVIEYTPPVLEPAVAIDLLPETGSSFLRLEWRSYPDYLDILQSRSGLAADDWSEIERFYGAGDRLISYIPVVGAQALHRVQRALR